jgi:phage terminase Nu1 subunit (DNA packaging protein)
MGYKKTILTKAGLASKLNLSARQIDYQVENGAPRQPDGNFCLEDFTAWVDAHPKQRGARSDPSIVRWKRRLVRAEAKTKELELAQSKGELISVDEVARENERSIAHAKNLLEQIPDRLMGLLPKSIGAKARKNFRDAAMQMIEDVLFALSDWEIETIGTPEEEG